MAKRHLAGMRPGSSSMVKFNSDGDDAPSGNARPVTHSPSRRTTNNAWHDVMEMCRKVFTSKMNSVGHEILQDVRSEMQRGMDTLREEIFKMLEEREQSSGSQMQSLMGNIDKLRQSTEEGVMNIQFDLSPAIKEMQRLDRQQSEARVKLEEQMEKMSQQLAQVTLQADAEEDKLTKMETKQNHAETLIAGVQKGQDMLAVSLESYSDEASKSRRHAEEEHQELVRMSHHLGWQFQQRLQEPVLVDWSEMVREMKKNHSAISSDFRMVLGEIGKIQQALHLDFIQMSEVLPGQQEKALAVKAIVHEVEEPPSLDLEDIPGPTMDAVAMVQANRVAAPGHMPVPRRLEEAHEVEVPSATVLKHSVTSPAPEAMEIDTAVISATSGDVVFNANKRGSTMPAGLAVMEPTAISRGRHKRVREFWSQTEPPPVETTAMQTDPVKFEAKKGKKLLAAVADVRKLQQARKDGGNRVFKDAEAMKKKARQERVKPPYNVFDYYHKEGWAQYVAKHWLLEYITLAVVCINTIWIAIDTDLNDAAIITAADPPFQIAENFFCAYFFGELLIRFLAFAHKRHCLQDYWFNFDLLLVVLMVAETWILPLIFNLMNLNQQDLANAVNIDFLRVLRLVRILRLSRMAKLLRAVPELVIIIKGIGFAARSVVVFFLLWSMIIYVFAIVLRQTTAGFEFGTQRFPSVSAGMVTLFLSGIVPGQATLVEEAGVAHWAFWLIVVTFVLLASVTIMYMLVGVLVEVMSVISSTEKEGIQVSYVAQSMRAIMHQHNYSMEVPLSLREFQQLLREEEVDRLLRDIGVDVVALIDTAEVIYEDFSRHGMSMDFTNLMDTILNLRGKNTATVKDVKEQSRVIKSVVQQTLQSNGSKVMDEFQYLRAELALLREEALRRDEDEEDEALMPMEVEETIPFPASTGTEAFLGEESSALKEGDASQQM